MKISVCVRVHIKTIPWKFHILNPKNSRKNLPLKFVNVFKSRLLFNILLFLYVCKKTFHKFHVRISQKENRCFNVKSSAYYFHMKTNILADFQICISVTFKVCIRFIVLLQISLWFSFVKSYVCELASHFHVFCFQSERGSKTFEDCFKKF